MKKHIFLAAILAATSSFSLAEGTNFTGFGAGAEIGTTKYSGVDSDSKSKRMTDINLVFMTECKSVNNASSNYIPIILPTDKD